MSRYGGPGIIPFSFTFSQWAKTSEVQEAWKEIRKQHDLVDKDPFSDIDRIFGFLDGMMLQTHAFAFNMDKAHKRGWFGTVDSRECILQTLNDFADLKMIPKVPDSGVLIDD